MNECAWLRCVRAHVCVCGRAGGRACGRAGGRAGGRGECSRVFIRGRMLIITRIHKPTCIYFCIIIVGVLSEGSSSGAADGKL